MSTQRVLGTTLRDIGSMSRLRQYAGEMKELKQTIYYVMPSSSWLKAARSSNLPLTFGTFDDVAEHTFLEKKMAFLSLTEQERALFFQRILESESEVDARSPKEKARALADTYGQLKRLCVPIEAVSLSLEECMPTFIAYEKMLKKYQALDPENQILHAANVLEKEENPFQWHVVVDGFYDFSPLQFRMLEALLQANIKVTIYLPNYAPLDIVEETLTDLTKIGYDTSDFTVIPTKQTASAVSLIKATTNREQWTGLVQDLHVHQSEAAIVLPSAEKDLWRSAALEANVAIALPTMRQLGQTSSYQLVETLLQNDFDKQSRESLSLRLLQFYGGTGIVYAKAKRQLKRTGQTGIENIDARCAQMTEIKWKLETRFIDYLNQLLDCLEQLELEQWLDDQIANETNVHTLDYLIQEKQALNKIKKTIQRKVDVYKQHEMGDLTVSLSFMQEWVKASVQKKEFVQKAGLRTGTASYSWQDIARFTGKTLYIPSLGADQFPGGYTLAGYIQESDLYEYHIPYGKPSQSHFRKKQEAYFEQLFYVAEELVFSFVEGVDPHHPLLPSPLLETSVPKKKWSFETRMAHRQADSEVEQREMMAYWRGKYYEVPDMPRDIQTIEEHLHRLQLGDEPVSPSIENQLKQLPTVAITALESYARCPIRYSFERLLQVNEPEAESTGVSFILIGKLVHDLIEWLYKELDVIERPFASLTEQEKQQVPSMIQEKLDEEWQLIEEESPHVTKLELNLLKQQWLQRLLDWWTAERKLFWDNARLSDMSISSLERPLHFEMDNGVGDKITLTGKIDRVDQQDGEFVIYDYKTGQSSLKMEEEVRTGLKLQLPLYSYILSNQLEKQTGKTFHAVGASYISLRAPDKRSNNGIWQENEVGKHSRFLVSSHCKNKENDLGTQAFLDKYDLENKVQDLWQGMTSSFPVRPLDCRDSCPYSPICRVTDDQKEADAPS
ncbi:PD-(D/E)XK nuclease family protein [Alkalicoccobacillus murimartini]|uniref:ATP-dependent helicase/DNAse subunit B n=1 Tax=Alkalicoccobacillus murimartini TaxID=171685 RepID=A0ABT9YJC6_9BACI|nr:PD-(D/E)XK nuclease family protein [Alkalicoccobacillus murimartini]MDQ0207965.1 ATP-dependent helicase/DNAse subunit B [Alkalicoccobacillus murimartini]